MKQSLFILLTIVALAACNNNQSGGGAMGTGSEEHKPMTINGKEIKGPNTGSFNLVNAPGKTAPVQMLAEKYWVIDGYIVHGDKEAQKKNAGRWYKFDLDGTFLSGRWQEQTANGSWTFDEASKTLHLDSNNDSEDSEWVTQMTTSGGKMVIIGSKKYQHMHIQGRMVKLDSKPDEATFGK